jgi:translocation and assembly module TamB
MPSSLNLRLTGNQAPVAWKREITARIDPDISLSGKPSALVLKGRLRIPAGRINLDRMAAGGPADIQVVGEQTADDQLIIISAPQDDDLLSSLSAELTIEVPGNVWLRGQDIDAEIAGEMKLKKKPHGPFLLFGALNTVRGNYQFQSRSFRITRGRVQFQGLKEPDPELDIRAEARIRDVEIIVRITGSARMLELSLESEPMMDKADIVSYLVFGHPTNALRTEQATNAQIAALDMAGQVAARQLKKILGDTVAVDEIRFEPGDKDWGSLVLGKYVTRNIFVTYRSGNFSSKNYGEVGVEYEINRHFSIETRFGNDLTSGIDLIWKTDF